VARYTVALDACALVPIVLADTLLRIAERGLYRPLWSERILAEAKGAIFVIHPGIDSVTVARRFEDMDGSFDDAMVTGWDDLEETISLPDPDDRHVVALAIRGGAQTIVTSNLADFPPGALAAFDLEAVHPDDFLLDQLDLSPVIVQDVVREQAAHAKAPPLTVQDLILRLDRAGVPKFAGELGRLFAAT
jgi:hypothetical protein